MKPKEETKICILCGKEFHVHNGRGRRMKSLRMRSCKTCSPKCSRVWNRRPDD